VIAFDPDKARADMLARQQNAHVVKQPGK
jgi:hypothetical protein